MRLTVIGSSPAWPNPGSAHSGYLVEWEGHGLLLDCGPGVLARLRQDGRLPVEAIVISHLHLDHWGDLVPWIWMTTHVTPSPNGRIPAWLPPGGRGALEAFGARFGHATMFEGPFALREYQSRVGFAAAGFDVLPEPMEHYGFPAYGFRVRDAAGATLAYSGDSAPCPALERLAEGADLFLCEATLDSADGDASPRGHMAADEALEIAGGVRTVLTHRPAELATPPGCTRATDGLVLEL